VGDTSVRLVKAGAGIVREAVHVELKRIIQAHDNVDVALRPDVRVVPIGALKEGRETASTVWCVCVLKRSLDGSIGVSRSSDRSLLAPNFQLFFWYRHPCPLRQIFPEHALVLREGISS